MLSISPNAIFFGDNLNILREIPDNSVQLIYIDPPFNTGRVQSRLQTKTNRNENGDRTGFGGEKYTTVVVGKGHLTIVLMIL